MFGVAAIRREKLVEGLESGRSRMDTMVAAISSAAATLPNHPKFEIRKRSGLLMTSTFPNRQRPTSSSNTECGSKSNSDEQPGSSELSASTSGSSEDDQSERARESKQPEGSELSVSTSGSSEDNQSVVPRESEPPEGSELSASTSGNSEDNQSKGESSLFNCSDTSLQQRKMQHNHPQRILPRSPPLRAHGPSLSISAQTNKLASQSMQALNALSGVSGAQYAKAVDRFSKKKIFMELFLEMPPHRRMDWLLHMD